MSPPRMLLLAALLAFAPMVATQGTGATHDPLPGPPLPAGVRVEGRLPVPVWEPQVAWTGDGALVIDRGPWRDGGLAIVEVRPGEAAPTVVATPPTLAGLTDRSIAWMGDRALILGRDVTGGAVEAFTYVPGAGDLTPTNLTFHEEDARTWLGAWGDDVVAYLWEDAESDLAVYHLDTATMTLTRLHAGVAVPDPYALVVDGGVAYAFAPGSDETLHLHQVDALSGVAVDAGVTLSRWYANAGVAMEGASLHLFGGTRVPVSVDLATGGAHACADVGFVVHRPGLVSMGDRVLAVMGVPSADPEHLPTPVGEVWSLDPEDLCAAEEEAGVVRFVVLGDTGFGDDAQRAVAAGIVEVCARAGCDLVMGTGDNIYMDGVDDVDDPQWATKFEEPYHEVGLPFHMTIGNHDAYGEEDAQVAYHHLADRPGFKWVMPDRWYAHRHGDALFVAIDTTDPDHATQRAFVREALDGTDAPWRFVHGHHPLLSNGKHGNATASVSDLLTETVCGTADAYFAGHDHVLEWLDAPEACGGTHLFVSGAGGEGRALVAPERNPTRFQRGNATGFLWVEVDGATLTARFHDATGAVLHEGTIVREDLLTAEDDVTLTPTDVVLPRPEEGVPPAMRTLAWSRPYLPVVVPLLLVGVLALGWRRLRLG